MSYRFERDESIPGGVRRIAYELVDEAMALLDAPAADEVEEAVHETRKNCKKLRGLVRLVRPGMGDAYSGANATFRDAARELSSIRDAHALLETFDHLVAGAPPRARAGVSAVRRGLVARAQAASMAVTGDDERIGRACELLVAGQAQIDEWPVVDDVEVIAEGLAKTYGRGRDRLHDCLDDPTDELLHQWRKRAKYTWYHVRLLRDAAPSVLKPLVRRLHDLSDALGDDHDLAVLAARLKDAPDEFGGDDTVAPALELVTVTRDDLQQRSFGRGARLYVEPADAFAQRLAGYWLAWYEHGDERATGEIADLAQVDDDLDERSVRRLYAIARDLDIAGRSSMDRDELIAMIRATGWEEG